MRNCCIEHMPGYIGHRLRGVTIPVSGKNRQEEVNSLTFIEIKFEVSKNYLAYIVFAVSTQRLYKNERFTSKFDRSNIFAYHQYVMVHMIRISLVIILFISIWVIWVLPIHIFRLSLEICLSTYYVNTYSSGTIFNVLLTTMQ